MDSTRSAPDSDSIFKPEAENSSEPVSTKLFREIELIWTGLKSVKAASERSVTEQPGLTSVKFLASAGIGLAISRLPQTNSALGLVRHSATLALGLSFALDLASNGKQIAAVLDDNWQSDKNWNANARVMEEHLGQFVFDTALMTAGGTLGGLSSSKQFSVGNKDQALLHPLSLMGSKEPLTGQVSGGSLHSGDKIEVRSLFSREINDLPQGQIIHYLSNPKSRIGSLFSTTAESMVRISRNAPGKTVHEEAGSGFFVTPDGKLATAFHVVGDVNSGKIYSGLKVTLESGKVLDVSVAAARPKEDLAILRVNQASGCNFKCLELAEETAARGTTLVAYGYPGKPADYRKLYASPGRVKMSIFANELGTTSRVIEGMSGGPVRDLNGKVQSLVSKGYSWEDTIAGQSGPTSLQIRALLESIK